MALAYRKGPFSSAEGHRLPARWEDDERTRLHARHDDVRHRSRVIAHELDCAFETICEGCTYFATTIEFRPTLRRQLEDADRKGQTGRAPLYKNLLDGLDPSVEPIS